MKWTSYLAIAGVAASLVAVPVAAQAQEADRPARATPDSSRRMRGPAQHRMQGQGRAMMMNPAERLLAHRADLGLTADQITRLEQIRDAHSAREKPYIEKMQAMRAERQKAQEGQPRPERGARRERTKASPEVQAAMDSLRASREAARTEASAVLTAEQREKARELMQERRERRPREMRRQGDSAPTRGA